MEHLLPEKLFSRPQTKRGFKANMFNTISVTEGK